MRAAEHGEVGGLVRYRSDHTCVGLHQDPAEEKLCNVFATALLMPTNDLVGSFCRVCIGPKTIQKLANTFDVSLHMTARKVTSLLGERSNWSSLWDLKTLWPVSIWECGMRTLRRRDVSEIERLACACSKSGREQVEVWPSFGRQRYRYKIQVTPLIGGRMALCFAAPSFEGLAACGHTSIFPMNKGCPEAACDAELYSAPEQLSLFGSGLAR
jgi:hypothetical protein